MEFPERIQQRLFKRLNAIYTDGVLNKSTVEDINDRVVADVFGARELGTSWHRVFPRLADPSDVYHVRSFLLGAWNALRQTLYINATYVMLVDGKLMTGSEVSQRTMLERNMGLHHIVGYKDPFVRMDKDSGRHVWNDACGKPLLDKPLSRKWLL